MPNIVTLSVTPIPVSLALQVSVGLRGRQVPREEAVCLLFLDSEETKGPWGTRGQLARKVSDGW